MSVRSLYSETRVNSPSPEGIDRQGLQRQRPGVGLRTHRGLLRAHGRRGKILHTRDHKSEVPWENATENPLDNSSGAPLKSDNPSSQTGLHYFLSNGFRTCVGLRTHRGLLRAHGRRGPSSDVPTLSSQTRKGGTIQLEAPIELNFLNSSFSSSDR